MINSFDEKILEEARDWLESNQTSERERFNG